METLELTITTGSKRAVVDLTGRAADFVRGRGDGLLNVFVPHATAGLAIIELGARSDDDLLQAIDDLLPATEHGRAADVARQVRVVAPTGDHDL